MYSFVDRPSQSKLPTSVFSGADLLLSDELLVSSFQMMFRIMDCQFILINNDYMQSLSIKRVTQK